MSKDMPPRCASHLLDIPRDHHVAICLIPAQTILQKTKDGWNRAEVARIVAMLHVHEDPPLGRHQAHKLMQNLQPGGGRKDVSEDIPETRDDIKLRLDQVKFFGAHCHYFRVRAVFALHPHAGLQQKQFRNVSGLCDPAGSRAIASSNIQHGAASCRYSGDHQPIDAVQIRSALFGDPGEHRPDAIVRGDWV